MTDTVVNQCRRLLAVFVAIASVTLANPFEARAQGVLVLDTDFGVVKFDDFGLVVGVFPQLPSGSAPLSPTFGMTRGPNGDLYVGNQSNPGGCEIWRFDGTTGAFKSTFPPPAAGGHGCDVIAFGPDGNIYTTGVLVDVVQRYNGTTGAFMGNFVTPGPEAFQGSIGLVFGPDDNLYVTTSDSRVLRYNGQTGGFLGTFVSAASGGLSVAGSMVFGPDANLYVVSSVNCGAVACTGQTSVLRYDGQTGSFIDAFLPGTPSELGDLTQVGGIVFGPDRNFYVTNYGSDRIDQPQAVVARYDGKTGRFKDFYVALNFLNNPVLHHPRAIAFPPHPMISCPDGNMVDSDGDGLLDCWERHGIDVDGDGIIDFTLEYDFNGDGVIDASEKADPLHKDLFVEVDWMALHQPSAGVLNPVIASFANAAVPNLDGTYGVRLHLLVDEEAIPVHDDRLTFADPAGKCGAFNTVAPHPDFDVTKLAWFGTLADRNHSNWAVMRTARTLVYHYALFVHSLLGAQGLSGCAELPGNDFVVSIAGWLTAFDPMHPAEGNGTSDHQAATFMHELGHNLGLRHGGGDNVNCKPNYLSIMNYTLSYDGAFVSGRPLDYSPNKLLTLDLNHLDETVGIGGAPGYRIAFGPAVISGGYPRIKRDVDASGAINWNGSNGIEPDVAVPGLTNFGTLLSCSPGPTKLESFDDWANLNFSFRFTSNFEGGGGGIRQVDDEPPAEPDLLATNPDDDGDGTPNMFDNCPSVANPDQADSNHNGIGDRCDPVNLPPTAQAGPDQVVDATSSAGASVTLSASASDPNGDPLMFNWTEGSANRGSGNPLAVTLPVGVHHIDLNVSDGRGGTAASTTQVTVRYGVCLLYDPNVAKKSGSTYPIKVQLCDTSRRSLSSASVVLHATGVTKISSNTPAVLDDAGNANPDFDFRYDAASASYIFNLKTGGYATGTYALSFTAGNDGTVHSVPFAVK